MARIPSEVRILPMSRDREFGGMTVLQLQRDYFRKQLPNQKGVYWYRNRGIEAKAGAVILFQYDGQIVAEARFKRREEFAKPKDVVYRGALFFEVRSIHVFEPPLSADAIREFWPDFRRFSNTKSSLEPSRYAAFRRKCIEKATAPLASDLDGPPASRIDATISRIIRDTKLADHVKALHEYKCQIVGCNHTIVLPDGTPYAEGHHIKPLGKEHKGPDIGANILCLCPNHHAECDLGARMLVARRLRKVDGHVVAQKFLDYHNKKIFGSK